MGKFELIQTNKKKFTVNQLLSYAPTYWNTHLYDTLDLNFWSKARSGSELTDEYGNNAQIITPAIRLSGTTSYIRLATAGYFKTGGTAFDVTFKFKLDDKTRRDCLFANGGASDVSKGITIMPYNGNVIVYTSDGVNPFRTETFGFNLQSNVDYKLRVVWNGATNGMMSLTLNDTVTINSVNVRGWSGNSSLTNVDFGNYAGAFFFKGVFKSVSGTLCGDAIDFYPCEFLPGTSSEWDLSVPGRKIIFSRFNGTKVWDNDSTYCLDYGYSIQYAILAGEYIFVPNSKDGLTVNMGSSIGGGTNVIEEHQGELTKHNLYQSYIRFAGGHFDRSDAIIWNNTCRLSTYYLASYPKDFYISELNFLTLKSWLNADYKGKLFLRFDDNSIDRRGTMDEIFCYNSDHKSDDEIKILRYSRDIRRCQRDINTLYIRDIDGYIEAYLYENLGGDSVANFTKYQSLLSAGSLVLFSDYNQYDVIAISQPLIPPNNRTLTINCELRIKDATFTLLTADVNIGDIVINVADTTGFNINEYIGISDNILPLVGATNLRVGSVGKIINIGAGTITIDQGSQYAVSMLNGGKVGHIQSNILIDTKSNITITGSGIINGNYTKQYLIEPVQAMAEAVFAGCGISVIHSDNIKILGSPQLTVEYCALHNISIATLTGGALNTSCEVGDVYTYKPVWKNVLCVGTRNLYLHDIICRESVWEDGIILYLNNIDFIINDCTIYAVNRTAFNILNNGICNGVINNIVAYSAVSFASSDFVINNLQIFGSGYLLINTSYGQGHDITLNNVSFNGVTNSYLIKLEGDIENILFNDMVMDGCTSLIAAIYADEYAGSGTYPINVVFDDGGIYSHTGVKTAIDPLADVTFVNFDGIP